MRRYLTSTSLLLLLFVSAHASTPLTWEDCVRSTLANNPELKSAQESLQSSELLESASWSPFLPQVTGALGYSYGSANTSSSAKTNVSASTNYSSSLTATQNLFAGFQDSAKMSLAFANKQSSLANLKITEAKVFYNLKTAFQSLEYAQEVSSLAKEILKRREENLRLVELRFQGGRENKGSVLLSEAYREQARLEILQSNNLLITAQQDLATAMGFSTEIPLDQPHWEITGQRPLAEPPSTPKIRDLVLNTPEHLQSVSQESAAIASLKQSQSGFYPSLNLTGALTRNGNTFFPETERWSVGLNLSLPIFSGGKDYYSSKSFAALRTASGYTVANTDQILLSKLQKQLANYREAIQKKKVDEAFYSAALTRAKIAREKYNTGLISFDDWDVIENDLIIREKAQLISRRDLGIAEAAWQQALGKGTTP